MNIKDPISNKDDWSFSECVLKEFSCQQGIKDAWMTKKRVEKSR